MRTPHLALFSDQSVWVIDMVDSTGGGGDMRTPHLALFSDQSVWVIDMVDSTGGG